MTDSGRAWFYAAASERKGPVPEAEISALIRAGAITAETLVWTEGMANWEPLRATPLAALLGGPPAMPGPTHDATVLAPMPPSQPSYAPAGAARASPGPGWSGAAYADGMAVETLPDAVRACFAKYVGFSGRAARPEYWWFVLFNVIASVVLGIVDGALGIQILGPIYSLAVLLPGIAVTIRRLHDTDRVGWWMLIGFIPLIGTIWLIVLLCQPGTPGPNRFGPPPPRRPKVG